MVFNTASLGDQAAKALKEEILSGRLMPEQRIDLNSYAQNWSLSPTPLRDAVKQLEAQGFVEVSPRRGVFVTKIDRRALKEIFELRIALECMAIQLATPLIPETEIRQALSTYLEAGALPTSDERLERLAGIDNLVHGMVVKYSGNARLTKLMDGLNDLIRWSRWTCYSEGRVPYEETLPEHVRICEMLCARDTDGAIAAMRDHLENTLHKIELHFDRQAKLAEGKAVSLPKVSGHGVALGAKRRAYGKANIPI